MEQNIQAQSGDNSTDVVEDVEGNMEVCVPEGLVHQVRHPDYPNTSNLPGYMQVLQIMLL